jgi:hypothetical protein
MDIKDVVIITPYFDFGRLVCDCLSTRNSWRVNFLPTVSAVAKNIDTYTSLDFALIDLDLGMERVRECTFIIREKYPYITLILITKDDPPSGVAELFPWKILHKPFVEKDLIELFRDSNSYQSRIIESKFLDPADVSPPAWAEDKEGLQQILVNAVPELDIVEAYILTGEGILAQTAIHKTIDTNVGDLLLQRHLNGFVHGEVLKQVRISDSKYILHGSFLAIGIVLAVLFNNNTPFQIVRGQSRYLAARIASHYLEGAPRLALPERVKVQSLMDIVQSFNEPESEITKPTKPFHRVDTIRTTTIEYQTPESELIHKDSTKRKAYMRPARIYKRPERANLAEEDESLPYELRDGKIEVEPSEAMCAKDACPINPQAEYARQYGLDIQVPGRLYKLSRDSTHRSQSTKISQSHTRPNPDRSVGKGSSQEGAREGEQPNKQANSPRNGRKSRELFYACLLIPRFQSTPIVNDVKTLLVEEMGNIFLSNGWRLESLFISKYYLQWIVLLPATISPAKHIKIVREVTSKMILPYFSRLSRTGLLKDYWAPGHLLESGGEPISRKDIEDFIVENRNQYYPEGLSPGI